MEDEIHEKVYDIFIVLKEITEVPQTYDTILQSKRNNGTLQTILRRKLNSLCRSGEVCKTTIPGTRFGKVIFYCIPKKYYILVEGTRLGSATYYFYSYKKLSRYYMQVDDCWELIKGRWEKISSKTFFEGNVLKFI